MRPQVGGIYPWPYDGPWSASETALVIVDMQQDFLAPDGWFAATGGDPSSFTRILPNVAKVLSCARKIGMPCFFTIEAHRPDLSDVPATKQWRARRLGRGIGEAGPLGRALIRGEAGCAIADPIAPKSGEPVVAKPGKSAFIASDFDQLLRHARIRNLVFAGITTDGAVQCTLR
ncbi:MAG: cysteine hydrolase, partial [Hyphomicrobiales bacterium]